METNQEVYELVSELDATINANLRADPVNHTNWSQWLLYVRTLQTSLDVISHYVEAQRQRAIRLAGGVIPTN